MRASSQLAARSPMGDRYLVRIEGHLARLVTGHDPMGHLFAIERLARAARADWLAAQHDRGRRRPSP